MDIAKKPLPGQPTQDGHHKLKKSEMKRQPENLSSRHPFEVEADSDGNSKSVHSQSKSNAEDKKKIHLRLSLFSLL